MRMTTRRTVGGYLGEPAVGEAAAAADVELAPGAAEQANVRGARLDGARAAPSANVREQTRRTVEVARIEQRCGKQREVEDDVIGAGVPVSHHGVRKLLDGAGHHRVGEVAPQNGRRIR